MQIRKITELRYCDDDTGTYFEFFQSPSNPADAVDQIQRHMKSLLSRFPPEEVYGAEYTVVRLGSKYKPLHRSKDDKTP